MNTTLTVFNNHPNIIKSREKYKDIQIEFRADKKLNSGKWQNNIEYIFQIDRELLIEREETKYGNNKNGPSYKTILKYKIIDYNVIQNRTFKRKK